MVRLRTAVLSGIAALTVGLLGGYFLFRPSSPNGIQPFKGIDQFRSKNGNIAYNMEDGAEEIIRRTIFRIEYSASRKGEDADIGNRVYEVLLQADADGDCTITTQEARDYDNTTRKRQSNNAKIGFTEYGFID